MTAVVVKLDLSKRPDKPRQTGVVERRCEVIIFPGVFFERLPEKKSSGSKKPKRRAAR